MTITLPDLYAQLGDAAGDSAVDLWTRLRAAGADTSELSRALSLRITADNLHAGAVGEGAARAQLAKWGLLDEAEDVPATALAHSLDRDRLALATATVLSRTDAGDLAASLILVGNALHRLARSETVESAHKTYGSVMRGAKSVKGWTRELERDACQLCQWWSRDGQVWPKDHEMPTHKGCTCAQKFVRVSRNQVAKRSNATVQESERRRAAGTLDQRRRMSEGYYSSRSTRGINGKGTT